MSINPWGSDDPAEVAKGGTGNATLTDHGILLGSGTSPVTVTSAPTDGQILIGSTGNDPSLGIPTGDTNEIAVGSGAGTISVGIADNAVLPGTSAFTWVSGTTAQEPSGSAGEVRYDTDTDTFRGYIDGTGWVDFGMGSSGGGMWTLISKTTSVASGTTISLSGYTTYAIWIRELVAGTGLAAGTMTVVRSADSTATDHTWAKGYKNNSSSSAAGAAGSATSSVTWTGANGTSLFPSYIPTLLVVFSDYPSSSDKRVVGQCNVSNAGISDFTWNGVQSTSFISVNGSSSSAMSGVSFSWPYSGGSPTATVTAWGMNA